MMTTLHCIDNAAPCCIACFHHKGIHYHLGMSCLPGKEPGEMAAMVMINPKSAAAYILSTFLALPPEQREVLVYTGEPHAA